MQSLIGTINFACNVVPLGRPFVQRMIALTRNIKKPHHHIKLNFGFFQDLEMWKKFISDWNGANFFLSSEWHDSDTLVLHILMPLVHWGIFEKKLFQGASKPHQKHGQPDISISWQEFFATVVAYHIWGDLVQDHRIKFHCDTEAVVTIIDTKHSRIPRVMDLLRHPTLLTFQHNIHTTNSSYCVSVVYHPPERIYNESDLLDFLSEYCEKILLLQTNAKIIIAGDVDQLRGIGNSNFLPIQR